MRRLSAVGRFSVFHTSSKRLSRKNEEWSAGGDESEKRRGSLLLLLPRAPRSGNNAEYASARLGPVKMSGGSGPIFAASLSRPRRKLLEPRLSGLLYESYKNDGVLNCEL